MARNIDEPRNLRQAGVRRGHPTRPVGQCVLRTQSVAHYSLTVRLEPGNFACDLGQLVIERRASISWDDTPDIRIRIDRSGTLSGMEVR